MFTEFFGFRPPPFRTLAPGLQGAVLSPPSFVVYLDDLLKELRNLGFGAHMADN